jgi:hypothetical protein
MSGIPSPQRILARYLPFTRDSLWWLRYRPEDLPGDLIAGLVTATLLVPQSMADALLAGLPPQTGLYAAILPVIAYGFLGSSRALSVGPVAIISLLVASGLEPLAEPGSPEYGRLALGLALEAGLIQVGVGLLRLGFLANFLSRSVVTAFGSAAALIIAFSQLRHLLGVKIANTESFWLLLQRLWQSLEGVNWATPGAVGHHPLGVRPAEAPRSTAPLGDPASLEPTSHQGRAAGSRLPDHAAGVGVEPLGKSRSGGGGIHSGGFAPPDLPLAELARVASFAAHSLGH